MFGGESCLSQLLVYVSAVRRLLYLFRTLPEAESFWRGRPELGYSVVQPDQPVPLDVERVDIADRP